MTDLRLIKQENTLFIFVQKDAQLDAKNEKLVYKDSYVELYVNKVKISPIYYRLNIATELSSSDCLVVTKIACLLKIKKTVKGKVGILYDDTRNWISLTKHIVEGETFYTFGIGISEPES